MNTTIATREYPLLPTLSIEGESDSCKENLWLLSEVMKRGFSPVRKIKHVNTTICSAGGPAFAYLVLVPSLLSEVMGRGFLERVSKFPVGSGIPQYPRGRGCGQD